jgi:replicative DNA helicase
MGGRVYVVGARPSVGKSAFGLTMASNIARKYKNNGSYISLEMSNEELTERLLSMSGSIDSKQITTMKGIDFKKLETAFVKVCGLNMLLRVMSRPKVEQVKNFARSLKRRGKLDYLVLDHLHLMGYPGVSEVQGIAHITGELKGLALELGIPIVLLAQLNRGNAKEDRLPAVTDLRGSGAIEQDADVIMLLHRDEELDNSGKALLLLRKNRSGENNKTIVLHQSLQYFRFDNMVRMDEVGYY